MYIKRTIEESIRQASETFPAVLVTGPRQVGKTTVLKECAKNISYVSLDKLSDRNFAKNDPELFLQRYQTPLLIDEVQYASELFPYIKANIDEKRENGMYWLTGSQQFQLMKNISESMAGRVAILNLQGLSQREKFPLSSESGFIDNLSGARNSSPKIELKELYELIWKGSYPALISDPSVKWKLFYESYITTYIERDVKDLLSVSDNLVFSKFMRAIAARTGQLLNYSEIANDIGISSPTVKSWVSILQTSGIIFLLEPYYKNITKRMIKMPKIYFMDTGLACYLTGWPNSETLELSAMNGAFFETYVISEIVKSFWHNGERAPLFFYRDKEKHEIDLIIEKDGKLHPVEIKKKTTPDKGDIKHFKVLDNIGSNIGQGYVICMCDTDRAITENVTSIPVGYI